MGEMKKIVSFWRSFCAWLGKDDVLYGFLIFACSLLLIADALLIVWAVVERDWFYFAGSIFVGILWSSVLINVILSKP